MTVVTPQQEKKLGGFRVTTCELDFMSAADILPTVMEMGAPIIGLFSRSAFEDDGMLESLLMRLAGAMAGGKLRDLLPKLLATTTAFVPTGDNGRIERVDLTDEDQINKAFTGRKKLGMEVVRWALEVNFKDFLDVSALIGLATRKRSRSPASSPSTNGATSDTDSGSAVAQP